MEIRVGSISSFFSNATYTLVCNFILLAESAQSLHHTAGLLLVQCIMMKVNILYWFNALFLLVKFVNSFYRTKYITKFSVINLFINDLFLRAISINRSELRAYHGLAFHYVHNEDMQSANEVYGRSLKHCKPTPDHLRNYVSIFLIKYTTIYKNIISLSCMLVKTRPKGLLLGLM